MQKVTQFLERNKVKIKDQFTRMSKQDQLQATMIFSFLRNIFQKQSIRFFKNGKDYFSDDDNQSHTQKIIEQYYKTTPDGKSGKFYLYRISFNYDEVIEYLQFWMNKDKTIMVQDSQYIQPQMQKPIQNALNIEQQATNKNIKGNAKLSIIVEDMRQSVNLQNQFMVSSKQISQIKDCSEIYIQGNQKNIERVQENSNERIEFSNQTNILSGKLCKIENQNINTASQIQKQQLQQLSNGEKTQVHKKAKTQTEVVKFKKQLNLKYLFDFYAKQNHLTGVKASFQRIQHESQTINYQKLVHFLKEYELFPNTPKDQKKLHNLYVRTCSNTRDLHYEDFIQLLQKIPEIVIQLPEDSIENKKDIMMAKIQSKTDKKTLLLNPFHSLQKHNFRIDPTNIKYEFKLQPLKGKLQQQVNNELQNRKKLKEQTKQLATKEKQEKHKLRIKKLMLIDPFNPLVVKNAHILQERSSSVMQPIASLDNIQHYRDNTFDMKAQFGISDYQDHPLKQITQRYEIQKRVHMMEKQQKQRMSVLMNSLVQRQDAKLAKIGVPARKRQISSKAN